ncbi:unnamed protein product [Orchesella dallaii]|uniref:Ionotropic glutamate receptor L-glutamate and glycine-binding domain-containing protein n=1 Tax=Orchesella dallaii TaxID=48710 RepID=A0ABP1QMW4_9HEXA
MRPSFLEFLFSFVLLSLFFESVLSAKSCCLSHQLKPQQHLIFPINSIIDWIISSQKLNSVSVKVLTASNSQLDPWLSYLGEHRPIITGNVDTTQIGKPVIALLFSSGTSHFAPNLISNWIKQYNNRRRDHFIFTGNKLSLLQLWEEGVINKLHGKWGYTTDTNEFLYSLELNPAFPYFTTRVDEIRVPHTLIGRNIRGRHFRFSTWPLAPPYVFISAVKPNGERVADGAHVRIFSESFSTFNFTYYLHLTHDATYGRLLDNGTWTGMIGDLVDDGREFDSCLFAAPTVAWYQLFDFAGALSIAGVRFLTPKPLSEMRWQAFLTPFKPTLWFSLVLIYLKMVVLMFLFEKLSTAPKTNSKTSGSFVTSAMVVFQIAVEQNAKVPPGNKLLAGLWLLLIIISGTAYKSQVFSSLTLPFTDKLPSTYRDLALHPDYTMFLNNLGGLEADYFEHSESPSIRQIAKNLQYKPNPMDCFSSAVLNPKSVCTGWVPFLKYMFAESASPDPHISPVHISSDAVMTTSVSVPFSKYSPFVDGFAPIISAFWESGIYVTWENDVLRIQTKKGFAKYNENPNSSFNKKLRGIIDDFLGRNSRKPLKISNLKMMFAILVAGNILSLLTFLVELTIANIRKTKTTTTILIQTRTVTVRSIMQT